LLLCAVLQRRPAGRRRDLSIDRFRLRAWPTAANPLLAAAAGEKMRQSGGQTDRQTDEHRTVT